MEAPLHWRKPRTVFVCSMSDLFHPLVRPEVIHDAYLVMSACPQHTFIVCTKRPGRIVPVLYDEPGYYLGGGDYLPNVWHLVSTENQEQADIRIPELLKLRNASQGWTVLGVSAEPLLEQVDLTKWLPALVRHGQYHHEAGDLSWAIAGCETGPHARPMKLSWARDMRDQCKESGVPFFMKKVSGSPQGKQPPDDLMVREWPEAETITPLNVPERQGGC